MTVGDRIKEIRVDFELTQEEFGKRVNVGRSHVSSVESGARGVSDRLIKDVCRAYGVSHEWLTTGVGEKYTSRNSFIQAAVDSLKLVDQEEREFVTIFLNMPEKERKAFMSVLGKLIGAYKEK